MRMRKVFLFTFITMLFLGSCTSNNVDTTEPTPREIKILFNTEGNDANNAGVYSFYRITDGNALEVYSFRPPMRNWGEDSDVFDMTMLDGFVCERFGRVISQRDNRISYNRNRVLLERQLNKIWRLAENVEENDFGYWSVGTHNPRRVWVLIDDTLHWSLFSHDIRGDRDFFDRDLLELVYYILDLSPV
jgi:hypothetical protein